MSIWSRMTTSTRSSWTDHAELIVDTVCSRTKDDPIAGDDYTGGGGNPAL